jgi:ATP-dependent helicase/DNAse subunit B
MYAYLFYRVLQRAGHVNLLYTTESDKLGSGELSRFVQQLLLESGLTIEREVLHNTVHVNRAKPIEIAKTPEVLAQMEKFIGPSGSHYLSPSSLNDFIECSLRFYLSRVAELKQSDEVQEQIDASVLGTLLHDVMAWLYDDWRISCKPVAADEFREAMPRIPGLIERAFRKHYQLSETETFRCDGHSVVVKEVVEAFARRILEIDAAQAPVTIIHLEEKFEFPIRLADGRSVRVAGKIKRVLLSG